MFETLPRYEDLEITSVIPRSYLFFVPTFLTRYEPPTKVGRRFEDLPRYEPTTQIKHRRKSLYSWFVSGKIYAVGRIDRIVALGTVFVEYWLHDSRIVEAGNSPFRLFQVFGPPGEAKSSLYWRSLTSRLVTADTTLGLAGHQMREASHSLQGSALFIEDHEIDWHTSRNAEISGAVRSIGNLIKKRTGTRSGSVFEELFLVYFFGKSG